MDDHIARAEQLLEKGSSRFGLSPPKPPERDWLSDVGLCCVRGVACTIVEFPHRSLGPEHTYVEAFTKQVGDGHTSCAKRGIGILTAVREDLTAGTIGKAKATLDPLLTVVKLCSRFHQVARQLRSRREDRATLDVRDEHDVQDLMHALLWIDFVDVRPEEATPSYAAKSSRMDFLLKQEQIVIEVKRTRPGLGAREIASELIEDIDRYKAHPECKALVCFVYDPEGLVANPRGVEGGSQPRRSSVSGARPDPPCMMSCLPTRGST